MYGVDLCLAGGPLIVSTDQKEDMAWKEAYYDKKDMRIVVIE